MLTLITVNYNCAAKTRELLKSLEQQTSHDFDLIVVDNDSQPEDRGLLGEYAASSHLRLDVIYSETNRGFSGGNNLAIRKAIAQGSEWILLINPDTTVEPDFIASVTQHEACSMKHGPALIGLPLKEGSHIAYAGIIQWLRPTLAHLYSNLELSTKNLSLLYVIGAGILIHRDVFEKVGMLDERYFLYFEDADFSIRVRKAGVPIHFVESPVISHGVSQSTKQLGSPLLLRYHARNALLFNWIHGPWWVKIALPFWSFFAMLKQIIKLIVMPSRRPQSRAIATGIIDFYAQRFGKIAQNNQIPGVQS